MAQIVCNDCKSNFDEEGLTQCPHCDAAIGTIKVLKSVTQSDGTITKQLIAERIGTRSSGGAADMLISGEEGCDIVFVERMGKAKYSASNPYQNVLKKTLVLILSILSISSYAQKKPTLMILPSDNWCTQRHFTIEYDNQGVMERVPNYQQAFQEDLELNPVISKIGELMTNYGYSLKDAEMELRNIRNRIAEDNVTFSKTSGAEFSESPLDMLKRKAKADIIIQIGWSVQRISSGRALEFIIEAFDAYTSKRIATATGKNDASNCTIQDALSSSISKQLKNFDRSLDSHFSSMKRNGREIIFTIRKWNDCDIDLETEFDGEELLTHIQNWLSANTVNGHFSLTDATEDMAQFEQVKIPLKDNNGKDVDARSFIHSLQKELERVPYEIETKLMMRGLGEVILVLGEK